MAEVNKERSSRQTASRAIPKAADAANVAGDRDVRSSVHRDSAFGGVVVSSTIRSHHRIRQLIRNFSATDCS